METNILKEIVNRLFIYVCAVYPNITLTEYILQ